MPDMPQVWQLLVAHPAVVNAEGGQPIHVFAPKLYLYHTRPW